MPSAWCAFQYAFRTVRWSLGLFKCSRPSPFVSHPYFTPCAPRSASEQVIKSNLWSSLVMSTPRIRPPTSPQLPFSPFVLSVPSRDDNSKKKIKIGDFWFLLVPFGSLSHQPTTDQPRPPPLKLRHCYPFVPAGPSSLPSPLSLRAIACRAWLPSLPFNHLTHLAYLTRLPTPLFLPIHPKD
jgi:hypothetical protein